MEIGGIIAIVLGVIVLLLIYGLMNSSRKIEKLEDNNNALADYNEQLEEFIKQQSVAIEDSNRRLNEIDDKGFFRSDDEIGWFFSQLKELQENLNQFRVYIKK